MTDLDAPPQTTLRQNWRPLAIGAAALAVAAVAVAAVVGPSDSPGDGEPAASTGPSTTELSAACQSAVKNRLKAPATAQFSEEEIDVTLTPASVRGAVDAQNGFGALLRLHYICRATSSGSSWTITDAFVTQG